MLRVIYSILGIALILAGCSPASTSSPAATWTATAAPAATSTVRPTDVPSPTATATVTPTETPRATATATPAPVDVAAWRLPLLAAGLTVDVIERMEGTAAGLQGGTLASVEAGIDLLGYQMVLGTMATELDKAPPAGRAARYGDVLRANLAGVFGVLTRWQQGEVTSATAAVELAPVRAGSEEVLAEMIADLRSLGVSEEQIGVLMMEIGGVFDE